MSKALSGILMLGWIDIFNPVAISMVMVLLSMVRKQWHVLIYVYGAYIAYVCASIAIFLGVDRFLLKFIKGLSIKHPTTISIILILVASIAIIGCILLVISFVKAIKEKREMTFEKVLFIKSVEPWFILLLSFGSTLSIMFFAYPMLTYICILAVNQISINNAAWLILLFCMFSFIPSLGVYLLATKIHGEKFENIMNTTKKIMNGFCLYSIPIVLLVLAVFCFRYSIPRLV